MNTINTNESTNTTQENEFTSKTPSDYKIQLIIVGDAEVGKTSILLQYTKAFFTNQQLSTIGCDYYTKNEKVGNNNIKVKIWDTAGQERYRSLTQNFYRNADGVLIVYDVTDRETFDRVKEWIYSIYQTKSRKKIKLALIGNKIDINARQVTTDEGKKLAEHYDIPFFETSAKSNIAISDSFKKLIDVILVNMIPSQTDTIKLQPSLMDKIRNTCMC